MTPLLLNTVMPVETLCSAMPAAMASPAHRATATRIGSHGIRLRIFSWDFPGFERAGVDFVAGISGVLYGVTGV